MQHVSEFVSTLFSGEWFRTKTHFDTETENGNGLLGLLQLENSSCPQCDNANNLSFTLTGERCSYTTPEQLANIRQLVT